MNAVEVLKHGHRTVLEAVDGLAEADAMELRVGTVWSTKEIIAHLGSFELLLEDVSKTFTGGGQTPTLDAKREKGEDFNESEVAQRRGETYQNILTEYRRAHERVMSYIEEIPAFDPSQGGDDSLVRARVLTG